MANFRFSLMNLGVADLWHGNWNASSTWSPIATPRNNSLQADDSPTGVKGYFVR
jgi:hypothetical protein